MSKKNVLRVLYNQFNLQCLNFEASNVLNAANFATWFVLNACYVYNYIWFLKTSNVLSSVMFETPNVLKFEIKIFLNVAKFKTSIFLNATKCLNYKIG